MVSVIVPVYNAEKSLEKCISSILEQTYRDVELILVDDGSTDQSGKICEFWKRKDDRIECFYQDNSGVSAARNLGLEKCKGQYIMFVDADDFIDAGCCSKLVEIIEGKNVDIVFCEHRKVFEDGASIISGNNSGKVSIISCGEFEYYGFKERRAIWGALYKSEIIQQLKFPEKIAIGEDALFLINAINRASYITYYDAPLYNYVIQNESAYFGKFNKRKMTEIDAWIDICKQCKYEQARRSADAACAETAISMLGRYAGDSEFKKEDTDRLIGVFKSKQAQLIQYDRIKNRSTLKHILYGLCPHIFVMYWGWKNGKRRRNRDTV